MRLTCLSAVLLFTSLSPVRASDTVVASKIGSVTVFPGGALVTRYFSQQLEAGTYSLQVKGLPAEADPQFIRAEAMVDGTVTIDSVDTKAVPASSENGDAKRKTLKPGFSP